MRDVDFVCRLIAESLIAGRPLTFDRPGPGGAGSREPLAGAAATFAAAPAMGWKQAILATATPGMLCGAGGRSVAEDAGPPADAATQPIRH